MNLLLRAHFLLLLIALSMSCTGQRTREAPKGNVVKEIKVDQDKTPFTGSNTITRNIVQDKRGDIWMASFDGVFRYDGIDFINVMDSVSSARFFSVMEDSDGVMWFGSIGSGVFRYDGDVFQNFTTDDGLLNNEVVCIYELEDGNIWFGVNGGVSIYDGASFRNLVLEEDTLIEDRTGIVVPNLQRPTNEVNSIIEDMAGNIWLGTRGKSFKYDGSGFSVVKNDDMEFYNVRCILEDQSGDIWLGGNSGLWRYDGSKFTLVTRDFVGYIYEDKAGDVWTSSDEINRSGWALSRYNHETLYRDIPKATVVAHGEGMIFGILESEDRSIWYGTLNGAKRYDGIGITNFKN